jgi:hypothetical protein
MPTTSQQSQNQPAESKNLLSDHPVVVIIGVVAAIIAIVAFITGALSLPDLIGKSLQRQIIGTWQASDGNTMTFYDDGTFQTGGKLPVTGYYSFIDRNHIRIEAGGLFFFAGSMVYEVDISRNLMTLTQPSGESFSLQRIR